MSDYVRIDTPENVDLVFEPAGLGSRFLAHLVDGAIQWGAAFLLLMLTIPLLGISAVMMKWSDGWTGGIMIAMALFLFGFLFFGYKLLLEAFWNGQTVGKRVAGIRVVQSSGLPATFLQILIRNLMRVVDYLPVSYAAGAITILATARHQRLGDLVASTMVVREQKVTPPLVPQALTFIPPYDLSLLREHVMRLQEADLEAARGFWQRRKTLEPKARGWLAVRIATTLAERMGWAELPDDPEEFVEAVLHVRAKGPNLP